MGIDYEHSTIVNETYGTTLRTLSDQLELEKARFKETLYLKF